MDEKNFALEKFIFKQLGNSNFFDDVVFTIAAIPLFYFFFSGPNAIIINGKNILLFFAYNLDTDSFGIFIITGCSISAGNMIGMRQI